jgi:hypothetical protein
MPDTLMRAPWADVPPIAAAVLRPGLRGLAEEIAFPVTIDLAAGDRVLAARAQRRLRAIVELALRRFLQLLGDDALPADGLRVSRDFGAAQARGGHGMQALLSGFGIAAGLAWQRFVRALDDAGLGEAEARRLGEALFSYVGELSAHAVLGYAQATASV